MAATRVQPGQRRVVSADSRAARRARCVARRRLLVLLLLLGVAVIAVAANYGPLTHYLEARSRLEQRNTEIAALQAQNNEMQAQLSKLVQSGYLEELARKELVYSLPDEDLYILTSEDSAKKASTGTGPGSGAGVAADTAAAGAGESTGDEQATAGDQPGFFERLLLRIAALF